MIARLAVAVGILGMATLSAQDARTSGSLVRPFMANGRVRMDLVAGEYQITGSPENRVRLDWSARDAEALTRIRAKADVRGNELTLTTDGPSNSGLRFTIHVPHQSDLHVRLSAGDMRIEDVRGHKDVELQAGDLSIDVGRAADYGKVDASLWAGDIRADAFNIYKDGLFRSFDWSGNGPYRLHVHLKAGDLRLYSKVAERER